MGTLRNLIRDRNKILQKKIQRNVINKLFASYSFWVIIWKGPNLSFCIRGTYKYMAPYKKVLYKQQSGYFCSHTSAIFLLSCSLVVIVFFPFDESSNYSVYRVMKWILTKETHFTMYCEELYFNFLKFFFHLWLWWTWSGLSCKSLTLCPGRQLNN